MVRTPTTDVPDPGGAAPPVARGLGRGRGRAPACGKGRGCPRVILVVPPADPAGDPIIEEQGGCPQLSPPRYLPPSEREELRYQFEQLEQGQMSVTYYEARGAPARGKGQFWRGQPSRPPYSAPPPARSAPARPYFGAMPESPQGSFDSYFTAMPESSHRPPAIQAYSSGSVGHQVQQGQQPTISAPAAPPPRGGGQTGRGRPMGKGQVGRGQPATAQP
ncbi:PREDICTED: basic salivary proline-rich protein 2-like, partial [Nicotiana attenuata]|uniref:basic salivary proline-rich protein 2-like n=1 Tax=Nicotiana attenuata TaxID=49451 RepID=UPI000904AF07